MAAGADGQCHTGVTQLKDPGSGRGASSGPASPAAQAAPPVSRRFTSTGLASLTGPRSWPGTCATCWPPAWPPSRRPCAAGTGGWGVERSCGVLASVGGPSLASISPPWRCRAGTGRWWGVQRWEVDGTERWRREMAGSPARPVRQWVTASRSLLQRRSQSPAHRGQPRVPLTCSVRSLRTMVSASGPSTFSAAWYASSRGLACRGIVWGSWVCEWMRIGGVSREGSRMRCARRGGLEARRWGCSAGLPVVCPRPGPRLPAPAASPPPPPAAPPRARPRRRRG